MRKFVWHCNDCSQQVRIAPCRCVQIALLGRLCMRQPVPLLSISAQVSASHVVNMPYSSGNWVAGRTQRSGSEVSRYPIVCLPHCLATTYSHFCLCCFANWLSGKVAHIQEVPLKEWQIWLMESPTRETFPLPWTTTLRKSVLDRLTHPQGRCLLHEAPIEVVNECLAYSWHSSRQHHHYLSGCKFLVHLHVGCLQLL